MANTDGIDDFAAQQKAEAVDAEREAADAHNANANDLEDS